jgi:hypothetical protein
MNRSTLAVSILCASLCAGAADDPRQRQDLAAVIALHGKPCGEVVRYEAKADNDFIATCKDGNRYRVYVKDGRVTVEKQ